MKGTVIIISGDAPITEGHALFTMALFKPLSYLINNMEDIVAFLAWNVLNSHNLWKNYYMENNHLKKNASSDKAVTVPVWIAQTI